MTRRSPFLRRSLLVAAVAAAGASWAQPTAETPVRIVVPTTPGSTPDILARTLAPKLAQRWGRTVVVENKVGASGSIGAEAVVRAAPNGDTLLLAASTLATGASLQKSLSFDAQRDLTPIAQMGWTRLVLVTHPGTGFRTAGDLIAAARRSPGRLNYASPGNGTPNHLAAELFKVKTGTFITHIPYRGSGPQITDVLAGQVDLAPITIIAAAPHVKTGRLVALAITGQQRAPMLPGVPALSEVGVPGVQGDIWYGLFGPRGLAGELVARVNADVQELLKAEEKAFAAQGIDIETGSPQALRDLMANDTRRWADVVARQGIQGD